jgi:hypothetical protein
MLNQRLHYPASIMLVNQVLELISDDVDGLLDNLVLILISLFQLLLLHEQLIVVNSQFLNQVGDLLLFSPVLGMCLVGGTVFAAASWFSISIGVALLLVAGAIAPGCEWPLVSGLFAAGALLVAAVLLAAGVVSEIDGTWHFRGR